MQFWCNFDEILVERKMAVRRKIYLVGVFHQFERINQSWHFEQQTNVLEYFRNQQKENWVDNNHMHMQIS